MENQHLVQPNPALPRDFKRNNFDLLRIIAAAQVVLAHSLHHLGLEEPGWWSLVDAFPGVPIFFAISGYLISASYERSSSLSGYARNRLLRIFPGLWFCVFATILVAAVLGFNLVSWTGVKWLLAQLIGVIYTPSFLRDFGFGSYNGSLWTIPIELQFYLVLPALYWFGSKPERRNRVIGLMLIVFLAVAFIANRFFHPLDEVSEEPFLHKLFRYSFLPHIYLFLWGVLLQRLSIEQSRWIAGKGLVWLAAYLAFHYLVPYNTASHLAGFLLLGIAVISMAYTKPQLSERLLHGNDISYGVYIYHGLVLNIFVELGHLGSWSQVAAVAILTLMAGYLSWVLVERPFLRRKRQTIHPVSTSTAELKS